MSENNPQPSYDPQPTIEVAESTEKYYPFPEGVPALLIHFDHFGRGNVSTMGPLTPEQCRHLAGELIAAADRAERDASA
jgi:hypothetical protein